MSDATGIGGVAAAAVDLTKYILGVNTTTKMDTSGSTNSSAVTSSNADTTVTSDTDTDVSTRGSSNTSTSNFQQTDTNTKTNNFVQNSADPGVISSLKNLASQAISNSNDPDKTTGLLKGILQTAGDAMSAIFGQQKQTGLYNSSATQSQNNDILSRAAADASQAILGYRTGQQQLADTALNQLLAATSTQQTTGNVSTQSITQGNTFSDTETADNTATRQHNQASTQVQGASTTDQFAKYDQKTNTSSSTGMSIVCTWMFQNKLLSPRKYYVSTEDLCRKPWYIQKGYLVAAAPLVSILKMSHTMRLSRGIISIFSARTEQVCASRGLRDCKKSYYGWFARSLVASYCFLPCFCFLLVHLVYKALNLPKTPAGV